MTRLLIISQSDGMLETIRVLLAAPDKYECHGKSDLNSALHLLEKPIFGCCLLDTELVNVRGIREIEKIRAVNSRIPLIVISGDTSKEWEEEAILKGADAILSKPVRGPLLNHFLHKLLFRAGSTATGPAPRVLAPDAPAISSYESHGTPLPALEILRDFSRIFSFSLNLKSFTYQFALKLREIISVNRIAIFLEQPKASPLGLAGTEQSRRLTCLCSVGIEPELFDFLTLSPSSGIGQAVLKSRRILRSATDTGETLIPPDPQVQREFEVLGGQIAIPILDRERAIGLAVLGERLTGQPFHNEELQLLFHLMEELGIAIKNNLLHEQLLSNHQLISNVFSQLSSGCLVVDRDLNVLHQNPALTDYLHLPVPFQFANLPRKLASLLYESAHHGKRQEPFIHQDPAHPGESYRISITPFHEKEMTAGAILSVEDYSVVEAARTADLEASKLKMVALIAEKFAHEIRNALLPIETCRQLIPERKKDEEFQAVLESTLTQETRRISRLADQLLFLSRQEVPHADKRPLVALLEEAFAKAKPLVPENASLKTSDHLSHFQVQCDPASLKHAFFEVLLNGFQANPENPTVSVSGDIAPGSNGTSFLKMEFRDKGPGLTSELSSQALDPFFTTRNVGVGLGLSVTRKIIEDHHGKLEISGGKNESQGKISIFLPVSVKSYDL